VVQLASYKVIVQVLCGRRPLSLDRSRPARSAQIAGVNQGPGSSPILPGPWFVHQRRASKPAECAECRHSASVGGRALRQDSSRPPPDLEAGDCCTEANVTDLSRSGPNCSVRVLVSVLNALVVYMWVGVGLCIVTVTVIVFVFDVLMVV